MQTKEEEQRFHSENHWNILFSFFCKKRLQELKGGTIMKGTIKWYNSRKGYGFILGEDGKDIFLHRTSVPDDLHLKEGDKVEYETEDAERGPKAINIKKG